MNDAQSRVGSLKEQAYNSIRQLILCGALKPGDGIEEKRLMEQLGVGRTPLREAVNQLQQEDVLEVLPRRGTFVRTLEVEDISALFQVREELEPAIVRIATPMAESDVLQMFKMVFSGDGDAKDMIKMDGDFHRYLAHASHNRYFQRFMESIYFQNERVRSLSSRAMENLKDTNREHVMIIDGMLARDADRAANAMLHHVKHARKTALSVIFGLEQGN